MRRLSPFFCYEKRISPFPLTSLLWTNKILLQYFTANRDRISIVENYMYNMYSVTFLKEGSVWLSGIGSAVLVHH